MSDEKFWIITVTIGFSTILILSYFIMMPMVNEQGMAKRTDTDLKNAIDKFEQLKELKQNLGKSELNP